MNNGWLGVSKAKCFMMSSKASILYIYIHINIFFVLMYTYLYIYHGQFHVEGWLILVGTTTTHNGWNI